MAQDPRPAYEGRRLPRPDEEVVDQGLGFDLATLASRRHVLRGVGLGAAVLGLAACSSNNDTTSSSSSSTAASSSTSTGEIPDETAGPYPGDGSNGPDVLEQSGVVRSDIRSSFGTASGTAQGVPMTLELTILDMANNDAAFKDVAVYVWHCDREGRYSLYTEGVTDQNYLRGVQIADASGKVKFTSIFPACYTGRWPHIHFEVYPGQADITDSTKAIATSQVALPKDVCDKVYATTGYSSSVSNLSQITLASDNVFGDDEAALQTGAVSGDVSSGFAVTLTVKVDTTTTPSAGSAPGGGGPGQGGTPPSGAPGGGGPGQGGTPPSGAPPAN
ncbi:intradiol ring-cleavage dioxygenase [Actinoplanes sp. LDG1-06]|uniref:Intradiol ring-cleavage dioxygenase n=1 Tax=Paractinoplanes ovalisporus TaxID=2810368 RepID=A0ABS2AED0_9ACTN|nr:intradiol ring-cleavage dioxygenase [Actinoplanes ovalisporus]MBM2618182.1 intradiol ring-cleavage dioxygenase [Actinoplanes ovalisporus]